MEKKWPVHIKSKSGWLDLRLRELLSCRDMIWLFVRRNIVTSYKQTILGPAWIFINPIISTVIFNIVFGNIARISTDGVPGFLFYLCGNLIWGVFSGLLNSNSTIFLTNSALFGKVYFPRLAVPISSVLTKFIYMAIQLLLLGGFIAYFVISGSQCFPTWAVFAVPLLLIQTALLAVGLGLIFSAATAKYRDLTAVVSFGVSIWMYATPVVYPLSVVPDGVLKTLIMLNPMTPVVEAFRYAFLGAGDFNLMWLGISAAETLIFAFLGLMLFNRVEKTFMDTV